MDEAVLKDATESTEHDSAVQGWKVALQDFKNHLRKPEVMIIN